MEPEDSIMLACIRIDLQSREPDLLKCFVSRDAKAFFDPEIEAELARANCKYLAKFSNAINYINRFAASNDQDIPASDDYSPTS